APEVAAVLLLDLAFKGAHPAGVQIRFPHAVVQDATVADGALPRRPAQLAPLELGVQMIILKVGARDERPKNLARDPNGGSGVFRDDGEDLARVLVPAERLMAIGFGAEQCLPTGQRLAVEQSDARWGRSLRGLNTEGQKEGESQAMQHLF